MDQPHSLGFRLVVVDADANDPAVLVAASAKWLPTNDRCGHARHGIRVKTTYQLC